MSSFLSHGGKPSFFHRNGQSVLYCPRQTRLSRASGDAGREFADGARQLRQYTPQRVVGKGAYGVVFTALDRFGRVVAIKKIRENHSFKDREVEMMEAVRGLSNVISILGHFRTTVKLHSEVFLHIVMEYLPSDLYRFTLEHRRNDRFIPLVYIKAFAYQMFNALQNIHRKGIVHRDIKPQNLLINEETGELKVCDFGSAKRIESDQRSVSYIQSRYYRAPELMYDCQYYTSAIDVWSAGCVLAEMFLVGQPIFLGLSPAAQLYEIERIIGPPSGNDLASFKHNLDISFPLAEPLGLKNALPSNTPKNAIDLLQKIFVYNPKERLTATKCLEHEFFDDLFDLDNPVRLPNGNPLPKFKK